jgi:hypothetical protein
MLAMKGSVILDLASRVAATKSLLKLYLPRNRHELYANGHNQIGKCCFMTADGGSTSKFGNFVLKKLKTMSRE